MKSKNAMSALACLAICGLLSGCLNGNTKTIDFSNHTNPNEKDYKTVLADSTQLKNGKPVLIPQEKNADWSKLDF